MTEDEAWFERGQGRMISINVRLVTDKIAEGGSGYVQKRHAWFMGDVGFRPNPKHELKSIGDQPIMFNHPDEFYDAILKAAKSQGVTLLDPRDKKPLV